MTLVLTCPNPKCLELNPLTRTRCHECGHWLALSGRMLREYRDCVYCGRRAMRGSISCRAHATVLARDPVYREARL